MHHGIVGDIAARRGLPRASETIGDWIVWTSEDGSSAGHITWIFGTFSKQPAQPPEHLTRFLMLSLDRAR